MAEYTEAMSQTINQLQSQLAATTAKLEQAEAELEALREVVEKLPVTMDGEWVIPMTDPVYLQLDGAVPTKMNVWANDNCAPQDKSNLGTWSVSQCCSTPEAALAAREQQAGAKGGE